MNKRLKIGLFAALCIVQLAVPASMLYQRETVLRHGDVYKFRSGPVDPYDPIRGRYLIITPVDNPIEVPYKGQLDFRGDVYIEVGKDEEGFVRFLGITQTPPDTPHYYKARLRTWDTAEAQSESQARTIKAWVEHPFDRYYINETLAPLAEAAYNRLRGPESWEITYVTVRIKNGMAVLEELYLENQPIHQYLAGLEDAN